MTTSPYMPDVQVHIAFDSGYSTPAASRTWTDVSAYVELAQNINITHGRGDEFATTDPNKLSLTLDNTDGRFTAGKTDGAYYPNVKIGRPIKVTSTPVGGAASVRFLGYVDEWPVEWTGTASYALAKITASSRMARLGFDAEFRSTLSEEFLTASPYAYFPLGEPTDATVAADVLGASAPLQIVGSGVDLGFAGATGPSTDAAPAALFEGGKYLDGALSPLIDTVVPGIVIEAFVSTTQSTSGTVASVYTTNNFFSLGVDAGAAQATVGTGRAEPIVSQTTTSPTQINSGAVVHLAAHLTKIGGDQTLDLYLDGTLAATSTIAGGASGAALRRLTVGQGFVGGISHVMVSDDAAGLPGRAAQADPLLLAEAAADRIERYAGYANIDPAEVATDADTNTVLVIDTAGRSAVDAMRTVEETEGGVLFDARDNTLTFHGRARRFNAATVFTLDVALQEVEACVAPKLDRSALVNDVTGTASDGTTARATNPTSIDDYGYARDTVEIASSNDAAFQAAAWRVAIHGEPQARVPSLGVDLLPLTQARQDDLLELDISSRITLDNLPAQAPATEIDFFIEGYTETIGEMSYDFDFNVSPTTGYDVFTLDDATQGVLDNTTYRLAY